MPPSPVPVPGFLGDRSGAVALSLLHAAMSATARIAVLTPRTEMRVNLFIVFSLGTEWGLLDHQEEQGAGCDALHPAFLRALLLLRRHEIWIGDQESELTK